MYLCTSRLHKNIITADRKKKERGKNTIIYSHYVFSYTTKYEPITVKWLPGNICAGHTREVL